jgi:hypothetical protein
MAMKLLGTFALRNADKSRRAEAIWPNFQWCGCPVTFAAKPLLCARDLDLRS